MRIRVRHVVLFLCVLLGAFILYATSRVPSQNPSLRVMEGLSPPVDDPIETAPAIAFETEMVDLGVIPHTGNTETRVRVHNRGGAPLEIREVLSSCPFCTVGYLLPEDRRIAPGQSADLHIVVMPEGIYGFHSKKTLSLVSNDPRTPRAQLPVEARVDPEFILEPESFDFGDVQKGEPGSVSLTFRQLAAFPVTVTAVSLHGDVESVSDDASALLAFEVAEVAQDGRHDPEKHEFIITARLSPAMGAGAFELPVFIHMDLDRFSPHRTMAHGVVHAPYELVSPAMSGPIILREADEEVRITVTGTQPFTVVEPVSRDGAVDVRVEMVAPDHWHVLITPAAGIERGIHRDSMEFVVEYDGTRYYERAEITVYARDETAL